MSKVYVSMPDGWGHMNARLWFEQYKHDIQRVFAVGAGDLEVCKAESESAACPLGHRMQRNFYRLMECEALVVAGPTAILTPAMKREIHFALALGIPIYGLEYTEKDDPYLVQIMESAEVKYGV